MKLPIFILAVLSFAPACLEAQSTTQSQITVPAATPYIIVNQDANNRVWQREQYEASPNGEIVTNVQTYTELATGLNFEDTNGNWQASQEEIEQQSDGTEAATQGQNKVYFPANLLNGEIKMITPDGLALNSQPAVLSYYDGTNTAIIAVLTNSVGRIVGPNQVIYTNAFSGLTADVLLTYRKSGLEQDIIVRQQPPTPESFGLNAATARLQVLTEFFDPPQPQVTSCTLPNQAGLALTDQTLGFGLMEMGSGRAFLFGQSATDPGVLVAKSWVVLDGRHFLVEEVPVNAVVEGLAALPLTAINGGFGRAPHLASSHRVLPHNKMERKSASERMLAKGSLPLNGFVLDYQTINTSMSNYNFKCDSTYYVSGPVNLYQTSTFEGGTVVKFATNGSITISGFAQYINCQGGAYRPVVFTAVDDNSVGDSIGSGTPSGYYGNPMLSLGSSLPTPNLTGVRFCYAQTAIRGLFVGANIYDAQFVNCQNGLSIGGAQFVVGNALFANTLTNIIFAQDGNASANIQNSTFSQSTYLATSPTSSQGITLALTNCIVANVTNTLSGSFLSASGNYNGSYSSGYYPYLPITLYCTQYPFQPVGAGYYYLTNGCGFQNVGTTNIFTNLLSQLPLKTTHAPALLTNAIAAGTVIGPNINVVRDNSATLDLGYHYDPLDYCTGNLYVDNDLTLTNGVAIGFYGSSGFASVPTLISSGTAKNMNELVLYPSVQEEPIPWGTRSSYNYFINNTPNTLQFSFTDISMAGLSGEYFFDDYGTACNASFNNCQFLAAKIEPSYASYQATMGFTNNLFQRCFLDFSTCGSAYYVNIVNNLFLEGTLTFGLCDNSYAFYQDVVVENNLFVTNIFSYTSYLGYGPRVIAYNGYYEMTALNGSAPSGSGPAVSGYNVTITNLDFQIGPLGNYYYPSSGTNLFTLVGNGSTTANVLGLYYFTTQTNQIIQGDSPVDIGYHYVATDTNGNPLATFGDGIPDYVDDPNGNGLPNWWELEYFGNTSENATNVDQQGNTLYYDYTNGLSPSGMPDLHTILLSSFSILTNQASKTWTYNPNQPDLATNQLTWTWPANLSCVGYGTVLGYSEVLLTRQEVLHISHSIANNERCQFLDTNGVSWIGVVTQAVNVVGDMEIYQLSNSAPPSIQLPYVLPPDYTNYVRGHSIVGFPCIWPHKNQSQLQAESIEGYVIQNLYNGTGDTLIVTNTGVPPFGSGTNLFATGGDSGGPHFLMFSNTPVILFALTSAFTNLAGVCFCDGYFVSGNATNWIYLCAGGYTNGMNMLNLSGYQKYQH